MIICRTGCNSARSILLANAGRGVICCVTIYALRAAMFLMIGTGIVIKTFVVFA